MPKEKVDYNDITTITVPNKLRTLLGSLLNHNETIPQGLERILIREQKRLAKV